MTALIHLNFLSPLKDFAIAFLRILTGAILPDGVDTVVLDEDVTAASDRIAFRGPLKRGANTRKAGEDVAEGAPVLEAGRSLTPADLALLTALGVARVELRARLRVAVVSTGDELAEPGESDAPHRIYDANRPMLLSLIDRWGMTPVDMGRVADDRDALRDRLDAAATQADAVLTSGGASAGDEDHVSALLRDSGALNQWRIAMKPGRPLALGPGGRVGAFAAAAAGLVVSPGAWRKRHALRIAKHLRAQLLEPSARRVPPPG